MTWRAILTAEALADEYPPSPPNPPEPTSDACFGGSGGNGGRKPTSEKTLYGPSVSVSGQSVIPDMADLEERAAVLEYDCALDRKAADDQAARDADFTDAAMYRRQLYRHWRWGLDALLRSRTLDRHAEVSVRNALRFIADGWADKAIGLGWTEAELMWGDERAPWSRPDNLGIGYFHGDLVALSEDAAVFESATGARQVYRRGRGDGSVRPPWEALSDVAEVAK